MHAYDLPVRAVWVKYNDEKGHWHGDTLPGSDPEDVPMPVPCVIWTAGKWPNSISTAVPMTGRGCTTTA